MISQKIPSTSNTRESKAFNKVDDLCLSWWLEVGTTNPPCINYYGPYVSQVKGEAAKQESEKKSQNIYSHSRLCQPRQRTIKEKEMTIQDLEACPPTFFEVLLGNHRVY
ncbi:DUF1816 domain-containing protein [Acaryochloris marina NIES-2412]|uniref:DUF1816 domain-containing protein n=1 Tax=Acaryochloris marina TaxID=155978 RepID=UPI0040599FBB